MVLGFSKEIKIPYTNLFADFIYFLEDKDFLINKKGLYILNIFITYFDPYTLYYYFKFKNWFKKNIKIENLENL